MNEESNTTEPDAQAPNYLNIAPVEYPIDPNAKPPSALARKIMEDIHRADAIEDALIEAGVTNTDGCCCFLFWPPYRQQVDNRVPSINPSKLRT